MEPLSRNDEIRLGLSKLKPVPKAAIEKKPIKVTPIGSSPQMQAAMKMKASNNVIETSEADEDDD
jgi:hypothetical protein